MVNPDSREISNIVYSISDFVPSKLCDERVNNLGDKTVTLEKRLGKLERKIDSFNTKLVATLTAVSISLLLLVINIIIGV